MPIEKKHLKNDDEHKNDSAHKDLLDSANNNPTKKHSSQPTEQLAQTLETRDSSYNSLFDFDDYTPSEKKNQLKTLSASDIKSSKFHSLAKDNESSISANSSPSPTIGDSIKDNSESQTQKFKLASLFQPVPQEFKNSKYTPASTPETPPSPNKKSDLISALQQDQSAKDQENGYVNDKTVLNRIQAFIPTSKSIAPSDTNNLPPKENQLKNDKIASSNSDSKLNPNPSQKDTIATTSGKTTTDSLASAQTQTKSPANELNTTLAKPLSSIAQSSEHKTDNVIAASSNTSHELKQTISNKIASADIPSTPANPEVKISKSTSYVKEEDDFLKRPKFGGAQTIAEASPPPIIAQPLRFNSSSSMARDTVSASQDMIQSLSDLLKSQSTRQANPEIASKPTADSSKNHIESNQHSSGDKTAASFSKMLSNISPSPTDSAIANHQKQDSLKPPSSLEINADKLIAARGLNPSPPSSVNDLARSSTDTTKAEIKSVSDLKSSPTTSDKEISRDKTEHSHQDNSQSKSRPEGKSAATDNTDTSQKNQRHNEKQDDRSNKDTASNQDKSQRPSDKLSDKANDTQNKNDHKPDHKIDNKNQDQPDGKDKVQGKQIKSDQAKPDQADNNNPNLRGGKKGADNIGAKDSTIGNKANNINNKPDMLIMDETKKRADANELPPVLAIGAAALAGIARHTEKVIEEVEAIKAANKDSNGTSTKRRPYIVRLGDSLNSIAKNTLGDKRFANLILTINRARIRFKTDGTDYDAPLETGLKIALPSENEALIHKKSFFAE